MTQLKTKINDQKRNKGNITPANLAAKKPKHSLVRSKKESEEVK